MDVDNRNAQPNMKGNRMNETHDHVTILNAMHDDVKWQIMLSALGVEGMSDTKIITAVITEWHIIHEGGLTPHPVPDEYQQYIRTGAAATTERDPFADYQTGVQIADALQVRPRTVRKHAQRLALGTTFGKQRIYSPADAETLRGAVSSGRPAARSETDWR